MTRAAVTRRVGTGENVSDEGVPGNAAGYVNVGCSQLVCCLVVWGCGCRRVVA